LIQDGYIGYKKAMKIIQANLDKKAFITSLLASFLKDKEDVRMNFLEFLADSPHQYQKLVDPIQNEITYLH
jgi:hypothetical protein